MRLIIILGLILALPAATMALSQDEVNAIADKVLTLNDPAANQAFNTLREKGVLAVSATSGDPAREIAFKVLELNDANVTAAFNLLKSKGAFEIATGLTPTERIAVQEILATIARCQGEFDKINPLVEEYNRSWIPGRIRIRNQISRTIEQSRAYLQRAQSQFSPFSKRTEPELKSVGAQVERTRLEFNDWIAWWNRTFPAQ